MTQITLGIILLWILLTQLTNTWVRYPKEMPLRFHINWFIHSFIVSRPYYYHYYVVQLPVSPKTRIFFRKIEHIV